MQRLVMAATAVGLALVLGGLSLAGGAKGDPELLQGSWDLVSVTAGGKELEKVDPAKDKYMVIKGDKMSGKEKNRPDDDSSFKLDPSKSPKHIDITPDKEKFTMPGIYEVKGDNLRIAFGIKDRPKDFADPEGIIMTLKRRK